MGIPAFHKILSTIHAARARGWTPAIIHTCRMAWKLQVSSQNSQQISLRTMGLPCTFSSTPAPNDPEHTWVTGCSQAARDLQLKGKSAKITSTFHQKKFTMESKLLVFLFLFSLKSHFSLQWGPNKKSLNCSLVSLNCSLLHFILLTTTL